VAGPEQREAAFAELMRLAMISVRASMGRRLRDHRESGDVCQSVAKSFVEDVREGRVIFTSEVELTAYLRCAVRSKLADLARRDGADKRGGEHAVTGPWAEAAATDPTVSSRLSRRELLGRVLDRLDERDRELVMLRQRGLDWNAIGAATGEGAENARQRFARVLRRARDNVPG
jgi:DNA-directed RNA polymerase specialized sigma24 family protein